MNKLRCLLCGVLLTALLPLSGCISRKNPSSQETQNTDNSTNTVSEDPSSERSSFTLTYLSGDDLNPFTVSGRTNYELLCLCYYGLYRVSSSFEPLPMLVKDASVQEDGSIRLTLRDDLTFTDGAPLTAQDVIASYDYAKTGETVWSENFTQISSYEAIDGKTLSVTFATEGDLNLNLLTTPVCEAKPLERGVFIGCSPYVMNAEKTKLTASSCGFPITGNIREIDLTALTNREDLIYLFNYGALSAIYTDPSDLSATAFRSDGETVPIPTARLTFLTVNKTKPGLDSAAFSRGLSYLIDRRSLAVKLYGEFADPVWIPFPNSWSAVREADLNPNLYSPETAHAQFYEAGFRRESELWYFGGSVTKLNVLVNAENTARVQFAKELVALLNADGFTATLTELSWSDYKKAIRSEEFDLYVGEIAFRNDLNISALFSSSVCHTGNTSYFASVRNSALKVLNGTESVRDFADVFTRHMPCIPLWFANDGLCVKMSVTGNFGSTTCLYDGVTEWNIR